MNIRKIITNLDDDEEIYCVYHQFPLSFFWHWFGGFVFLLSPFFFLYLFLKWGAPGSALLVILFSIGFLWLFRTWRLWYFSMLVATDRRLVIIDQKGALDRQVSQVNLDKINDISYRKRGLLQTLFNVGTLYIQITGALERTVLENLYDPARRQQELFGLKGDYEEKSVDEFTERDLFGIVKEIRSRVGEQRWQKIQEGNWEIKKDFIDEMERDDKEKARAIEQFFGKQDTD